MYTLFPPDPVQSSVALRELSQCCEEVKKWMLVNKLKLNSAKTECILLGKARQRSQCEVRSFDFDGAHIPLSENVRDLGVIIDANL